jgi:opacity protein-like surface antigen
MKMKTFIAMSAFMVMGLAASAQGINIGVKAGATGYKIDGVAFSDQFTWGYHLGGMAELMWSKEWGIQPELLFTQSNTQTADSFDDLYNNVNTGALKDVKLNYLAIPVLLNWRPSPFITFQAGPQFSVLMSKEKTLLEDGTEAFKNGNVSVLGGVQLNIFSFRVYGRYGVGLLNLNNVDAKPEDKWTSRGFQVGAGFVF